MRILLPTLSVLVAALASPAAECAPAAGTVSGWEIEQRTNYAGAQKCYVSPAGVRLESQLVDTIIDVPGKKVTVFKDDAKAYCMLTYEQWISHFIKAKPNNQRKITKGKAGKVAGIAANQYMFENIDHGVRRVTEEYWTAAETEIPTKFTKPLSDLADLPAEIGMPLKITQFKADGSKVVMLDTEKCTKAAINKKMYQMPVGYKVVKDPITLVLGADE
jgi:hypothetical protein